MRAMYKRWGEIAVVIIAIAALSACTLAPAELTPAATAHLPARAELAHVPFFAQEDYQCGPAALATVLQSAGIDISPDTLTSEVFLPGRKGSLGVELIAATRMRDRVPYPLPGTPVALLEQVAAGRPVLVMQNLGLERAPAWHFAVLVGYDLDAHTMVLRSGTTERLVVSERRFMRTWDRAQRWALVVLEPGDLPANADFDLYIQAVASLEAVGRLDAAEQAYARAHAHWPQSVWPVLGLANVRYAQGKIDAAETAYRTALRIAPNDVVAHNNLAEILLRRGCTAQAREHVQRAAIHAKGTALEAAVSKTAQRVHDAEAQSRKPLGCRL